MNTPRQIQLGARIQQATGLPVRLFTATSFSAVVEAMRAKRIHGMQTGVFSYLLAEKEAGAEAVATYVTANPANPVFDARLRPEYHGLIIVKKGRGPRTLQELRGRTFSYGDPAGTSDHLVPKTELLKAHVDPDREMKTRFAGDHAAAIMSVWRDTADAAATADAALRRFAADGQAEFCDIAPDQIGQTVTPAMVQKVYDACPEGHLVAIHAVPIPGTPFAIRGDLPGDLRAAIRSAVLSTADDPTFIRQGLRWYEDPSQRLGLTDIFAYYDGMRELARMLDLDLGRQR